MKHILAIAALLGSAAVQANPVVLFEGPFAPANWTQSIDGDGSISTSPTSVSLTTRDDGTEGFTDFSITVGTQATISFDWEFATQDLDGGFFERFGFLLNGFFNELTDPNGGGLQSGSRTVFVDAGDVFGFRGWSVDGLGGSSTTRVGNSSVPEPATYLLVALSLVGVAAFRRRASNG